MSDQVALETVDVVKTYPGPEGIVGPRVLNGVSLSVSRGQTIAILGPSGSGKSTLLNILGLLDRPDSGQVRVHGRDVLTLESHQQARVRNRRIGFIFQSHHLLPQCTVLENVIIPTLVFNSRDEKEKAVTRARSLLAHVKLENRINYRPSQLSGGERQRVAFVRALINQPSILLADEPTGSLDAEAASRLARLLLALNAEQGTALVVVTHSSELANMMSVRYQIAHGVLEQ